MTNSYFDSTDWSRLVPLTTARAEAVNAIVDGIIVGFDMLPAPTRLYEGRVRYGDDTGAPNAYVVTLTYAFTLTDGAEFTFKPDNTNTTASTVNVAALGAVSIRNYAGAALTGGELLAGSFITLRYDSAGAYFRIVNPVVAIASVSVNNNVKVSSDDTTPGDIEAKIVVGDYLGLTTNNPAGNETRQVDISQWELILLFDTFGAR